MSLHCCFRRALLGYLPFTMVLTVDLFWSWVSLYNTAMKVFFIASSVYILYLMKGPFRPTHDPNLDTFKIEYLLIGSFIASLVFNYEFSFSEVPTYTTCVNVDSLVIQHLAWECRNSTPTLHNSKNRRSREYHISLPLRPRRLSSAIYSQLALPIFCRRLFRSYCRCCRIGTGIWHLPWDKLTIDCTVCGFCLYLRY